MNGVIYDICETQGRVYEYVARNSYDMKIFSSLYLRSDFCKRAMDAKYSRFQLADELECWDFIYPEIGKELQKISEDLCFDPDIAYWIGFMYRQISTETNTNSIILDRIVSFDTMCRYYPGLHTVDEDMALDIVCKDFSLSRTA